ncbi:MAG: malonyl-ACP O-methyltransferase BioC [Candidatus Gastranaerophilales bacterium]|nr:malonyl-ACP O-methyltransferase BioC [Candidatus Gastranaerophilales bacterium]
MIDKELVKKRFKKSLSTYDENAFVQEKMASNLLWHLNNSCGKNFSKILEIGCGTGILTNKVKSSLLFELLYTNDIVESDISKELNFICGDAEIIDFPMNLDLIISNATFQWMEDFPKFIKKCLNSLAPSGILAFTTFGINNFKEISDITKTKLDYLEISQMNEIFNNLFSILLSKEEEILLNFSTPKDVLKYIQKTGTNALRSTNWTKTDFKNFCTNYQKNFSTEKGYNLTFNPYYFILRKN